MGLIIKEGVALKVRFRPFADLLPNAFCLIFKSVFRDKGEKRRCSLFLYPSIKGFGKNSTPPHKGRKFRSPASGGAARSFQLAGRSKSLRGRGPGGLRQERENPARALLYSPPRVRTRPFLHFHSLRQPSGISYSGPLGR